MKKPNNFEYYIKNTNPQVFLSDLLIDSKLVNGIINNGLYWKNLDLFLETYGYDITLSIFKVLYLNDKNKKLFNNDMYVLLKDEKTKIELFFDINKIINIKRSEKKYNFYNIIEYLIKNKEFNISYEVIEFLYKGKYKNIVTDNFYCILNKSYCIFELKKLLEKDKKLLNRLNTYINRNPSRLIYEILIKGFDIDLETIKDENVFDLLKELIDELLLNQKLKYSDIENVGTGSYSYVIGIGTKVLKVGKKRKTFVLKNHKRFLKPLLRTEIDSINSTKTLGCIEITERAETGNIKRKDIYELFAELRDSGYIWVDCKKPNAGRLLYKNKVHFDNLVLDKETINYTTDNSIELEKGELVIIDNDYIFSEEDFNKLPERERNAYSMGIYGYERKYNNKKRK